MKKIVHAALAAAALAFGGAALADAECAAGSTWVTKPGCGVSGPGLSAPPSAYTQHELEQWAQANQQQRGLWALNNGYYWPQQYGQTVDRDRDGTPDMRDRDRDGDGVRNSRDRYPDDPRYR